MLTKTASLLRDVNPPSHIVYPCADENSIAEAVGTFAAFGIRNGDAVVLVTSPIRREMIERCLEAESFDIPALRSNGQLVFLDAETLLSVFMADGMPDARIFKYRVGQIIAAAGLSPVNGKPRNVRMFGEMVSFLYKANNIAASMRLEEFWNDIVAAHSIFLFCAYSLKLESDHLPKSLLDLHSHDLSVAAC